MSTVKYRPEIDSLRAIAVLLVIIYHAFETLMPSGFIGVDVFFVLSGYLITSQIVQKIDTAQWSFTDFYLRRFRRLFPSLLAVAVLCLITSYLFFLKEEWQRFSLHLFGMGSFSSNLIYLTEAGYFDSSSIEKPLLHLWSLAVEEQFYLIWPICLILIHRFKWNRMKSTLFLTLGSLVAFAFTSLNNYTLAFYLPFTRFWEILAGAYITLLLSEKKSFDHILKIKYIKVFCLTFIILAAFAPHLKSEFRFLLNLMVVIATTILILPNETSSLDKKLAGSSSLRFIGILSYPLYLWHWPLLSFATILFYKRLTAPLTLLILCICFIMSYLTYYFVEQPLRFHKRGNAAGVLLFSILLAIGGLGLLSNKEIIFKNRISEFELENNNRLEQLSNFYSYENKFQNCDELTNNHEFPKNIDIFWCSKSRPGPADSLIIGDSHAEHIFPGFAQLDILRNWEGLGKAGCPPLLGVSAFWINDRNNQCEQLNNFIFNKYILNKDIKTVLLSFIAPFYTTDIGFAFSQLDERSPKNFLIADHNSLAAKSKLQIFEEGLVRSIEALLKQNKKIILAMDVPEFPFLPEACIGRPHLEAYKQCTYPLENFTARLNIYKEAIQRISTKFPEVVIYNAYSNFCNESVCFNGDDETIYYRDSHHLSLKGSDKVAQELIRILGIK